jgi:aspartyl-tRNA(Asn)/glutamyl-tRNA(Gln) amidotransferase subunit C
MSTNGLERKTTKTGKMVYKLMSLLKTFPKSQSLNIRCLNSKLPSASIAVHDVSTSPGAVRIDSVTIAKLERLSLVDFANEDGVRTLEAAIAFARPLGEVDTAVVEPMYSTLEEETLALRPDEVTEGDCRKEVLSNASKTEEDYFVAPPGNIPIQSGANKYGREKQ